jgi:hypothetical protein
MGEDGRVTVDEPAVAPVAEPVPEQPPPPPRTTQQQALERYHDRLRWWRRIYAAAIVVVLAAAGVTVWVAWNHGEIAHTSLHTVDIAPPSLPMQPPPASAPVSAWRSSDRTALGTPYWGGTVVTFDQHTVRGRNISTGAPTWSYTRTDRTVCSAIQVQGTTIALFKFKGDCDQVTALDSQTGARKWTRTLFKDGMHTTGDPTYSIGQFTVLITSPQVVYAIDPNGGLDRWTFAHPGCTIHSAVLGSQGALISQTCVHQNCAGLKLCFDGDQLLLRNGTDSRSDADKDKDNPDLILWNVHSDDVPVSADQVVAAADRAASGLRILAAGNGTPLTTLPLTGAASTDAIAQLATARGELVWIGGVTYLVDQTGTRYLWSVPTTGPATATPVPGSVTTPVDLEQATVLVPTPNGVDTLAGATGKVTHVYPVGAPMPGSSAYQYGTAFVVAGGATNVYR